MKFKIGAKSTILMDCVFDCKGYLTIGDYCVINAKCRIDNRAGVRIGNDVNISQEVVILTDDHDVDSPDFQGRSRAVVIEDYVWIGTRAMILPGCVIGKGTVVAAGAVVTKNTPPFSVVAGVPAKVIRSRNPDLRYRLTYRRLFQ
ncbi:MAG TPA: acyltransferase [Mucilaginibacter sp.]|jgi:maltose O-acetyltransferase